MKKYIAPELEIAKFKAEEIMLLSAITEALGLDAGESTTGVKLASFADNQEGN